MTILVTGGCGFIGSHTVDLFLREGMRVRVLDNLSTGRRVNLPDNPLLDFVEGDIRNHLVVAEAVKGVTAVLHLAAQVSVAASMEFPYASMETNVSGFLNVLDNARRAGVKSFVYASSAAVYGQSYLGPLAEDLSVDPVSPYGLEKAIDEQYARLYKALYGIRTLGLRYFNVFGPRQENDSPYSGVISNFVKRIGQGKELHIHGDGRQSRDFVFVGDVARANLMAVRSNMSGCVNVASGQTTTLLELVEMLANIIKMRSRLEFVEPRSGDIRTSLANVAKAELDLGFRATTDLSIGLAELWESVQ